jgi:hypothetical protein
MTYSIEELRTMIPVYVNGSLSEPETRAFEEELQRHPELEVELKAFTDIRESYAGIEDRLAVDSEALFARVRNSIRHDTPAVSEKVNGGAVARIVQLVKGIYRTPGLSWSLAGLQFAALLFIFILVPRQTPFETYSSPSPTDFDTVHINVVFNKDAKEIEIRSLLQELGATIIGGPSAEGLYVLAVKKTSDSDSRLRQLQASPIVRLARKVLSRLDRRRIGRPTVCCRLKNIRSEPALANAG